MPMDLYITTVGGYKCKVKVSINPLGYPLLNGWGKIEKELVIKFGDLLIFKKNNEKNIQLHVFSPDGCVKPIEAFNGLNQHPSKLIHNQNIKPVKTETVDECGPSQNIPILESEAMQQNVMINEPVEENISTNSSHPFQPTTSHNMIIRRDGKVDFCDVITNSEHIHVWFTIQRAHLWRLPLAFQNLPQLKRKMKVRVVDQAKKRWSWGLIAEGSSSYKKLSVSAGWGIYLKAHGLKEGDQCGFSYTIGKAVFHQLQVPHV